MATHALDRFLSSNFIEKNEQKSTKPEQEKN
jgi:hypothetical protein